jgi:hypothetical protein
MKRSLATAVIGSGLLVLVGLAIVRRSLAVESEIPARIPQAAIVADVPERSVTPTRPTAAISSGAAVPDFDSKRALRHAEPDFWEDLGSLLERRSKMEPAKHRENVLALTAEYLGLDPSRAAVFNRTAAAATEEIGRAWKLRNESVEALSEAFTREERERKGAQIQETYETAKVQALVPLESLLENTPRHDVFRRRLGEWLDAVR